MAKEKDQETLEAEENYPKCGCWGSCLCLHSEIIVGCGRASGDRPRKCLVWHNLLTWECLGFGRWSLIGVPEGMDEIFTRFQFEGNRTVSVALLSAVFLSFSPVGCSRTGEVPPLPPLPPAESFWRAAKGAQTHFTPLIHPGMVLKAVRSVLWCNFIKSSGEPSPCLAHFMSLSHVPLPALFSVAPSCSLCCECQAGGKLAGDKDHSPRCSFGNRKLLFPKPLLI